MLGYRVIRQGRAGCPNLATPGLGMKLLRLRSFRATKLIEAGLCLKLPVRLGDKFLPFSADEQIVEAARMVMMMSICFDIHLVQSPAFKAAHSLRACFLCHDDGSSSSPDETGTNEPEQGPVLGIAEV